jgi:hypothetical protein
VSPGVVWLVMETYSTRVVGRREKCADCGANADHAFQADTMDASGYVGDVSLCRACLKAREVARQFPFARRTTADGGPKSEPSPT